MIVLKKTSIIISLLLIFILSYTVRIVNAEGTTPGFSCLYSVRCNAAGAGCSNTNGHRAKLTIITNDPKETPPANTDLVVWECLATPNNGEQCITGDKTQGDTVAGYTFEGLFAQDGTTVVYSPDGTTLKRIQKNGNSANFIIDPSGAKKISTWLEWQSSSAEMDRQFKVTYTNPPPAPTNGQQQAQKQSTIPKSAEGGQRCAKVNWDPDGTVFDSMSLEPIPNSIVNILKSKVGESIFSPVTKGDTGDPTFQNPYKPASPPAGIFGTSYDGKFSFFVPASDDLDLPVRYIYRLQASSTGYSFDDQANIKPLSNNATVIYRNIYPRSTEKDIFEKKGTVEHRDIPLDPTDGIGKKYQVMQMGYKKFVHAVSNTEVVSIRTSHPFTKITPFTYNDATTQTPYKFKDVVYADKDGNAEISTSLTALEPGEMCCGYNFESIDMTQTLPKKETLLPRFIAFIEKTLFKLGAVEAQQKTSRLITEPIPTYLEGYAYDSAGKVIPNANVGIYLSFMTKPFYEVKADKLGYYKITSEYLPSMPYTIRYSTVTGQVSKITTSQFITQNSQFIKSKKINIYNYITEQGKVIATKPSTDTKSATTEEGFSKNKIGDARKGNANKIESNLAKPTNTTTSNTISNNPMIFIIIVLIFLIAGVGAIILLFMHKKNQQPTVQ